MNLGGTEKSFLNLLAVLPKEVKVDLLLLERKGILLDEIPPNVNVSVIENSEVINYYLANGARKTALWAFKKLKLSLAFKCILQVILQKTRLINNPFWCIKNYVQKVNLEFDTAIAYAGIHNFISWFILEKVKSKKKFLWIHFDVKNVIKNKSFGLNWYGRFDKVFCVSDNASKAFAEFFPKISARTYIFNNVVDREELLKKSLTGNTFSNILQDNKILTVGRLTSEKGQQMIPSIVKMLKDDLLDFKWYLIGDGNMKNNLELKIKELQIEDHLILLGAISNPYAYLRDCDLYVQTSFHEGYCITLKEALVFNRPIVTTNFISADNIVKNNKNALIVPVSELEIYEAVKKLICDSTLRQEYTNYHSDSVKLSDNLIELLN